MMTAKQEWFINKLFTELEAIGLDVAGATNYGSNGFSVYKTSVKEASDDISFLLLIKERGWEKAIEIKYADRAPKN